MHIYLRLPAGFVVLALLSVVTMGCTRNSGREKNAELADDSAKVVAELPMPVVPPTLQEPEARANYVVTHFWEAMDFGDTVMSRNRDFMEQNFVNFISFCPYAEAGECEKAVNDLLGMAQVDVEAYELLVDIADKYLYDPNSPMLSEELYIVFLRAMAASPYPDLASRTRQLAQLEGALKNRSGMKAADFSYVARDGRRATLWSTPSASRLLLIFYDPDCDHCRSILDQLNGDERVWGMIDRGELTVLAVHSGDQYDLWVQDSDRLPSAWIVGYEDGTLQDNESYVLRASPTMYLLDADKRVVAKDVMLRQLIGAYVE